MTKFQVSADKQFVLLAYNIQPVSFPPNSLVYLRAAVIYSQKQHYAFCPEKTYGGH